MAQSESIDIYTAVTALRVGGIVAFPTETVYGLGADATSSSAVRKIYAAKGRPATNPSIVHVASIAAARRYAKSWPEAAEQLAAAFWPGPLTLVVEKSEQIVPEATAGRNTVALRVPNHPMALELLRAFDGPVAAPSANRSGKVSPTTAEHVRDELGGRVDVILDGGACQVGIESTVLDLSALRPVILRLGGLSRGHVESVIGPVEVFNSNVAADEAARSPGLQAVHYSPTTPTFRFEAGDLNLLTDWRRGHPGERMLILAPGDQSVPFDLAEVVVMPAQAEQYARQLYRVLHDADRGAAAVIWVQMPPDRPEWAAIRDRLIRASKLY
jgi:L-threonylcarbamoyladenylate synthase